jgi:hypothetical protein
MIFWYKKSFWLSVVQLISRRYIMFLSFVFVSQNLLLGEVVVV